VGLGVLVHHTRRADTGSGSDRHLEFSCPPPADIFNDHTEESVRVAADASDSITLSDFFGTRSQHVPVGVAFSGGGWKVLAQHMGVARAIADLGLSLTGPHPRPPPQPRHRRRRRAAASTGVRPAPRVLAANSGGSWFLLLLGFSTRFSAAVQTPTSPIGPTVGAEYVAFMTDYASLGATSDISDADAANDEARWRQAQEDEVDGAMLGALASFRLARQLRNSWQAFVEAMLDAYEPGVAERIVGHPTNPSLAGAALVFHFTLASSSYLVDPAEGRPATSSIHLNTSARAATARARTPLPAFYSTRAPRPWVPLVHSAELAAVALDRAGEVAPFSHALPQGPMRLGLLAAASSAASGMLGSKDMIEQALAGRACRLRRAPEAVASHAWPILSLEDLAPCSDGSLHECHFPSTRLMDGYYFDNSGLVAALVELQGRGPARELRLFASIANTCERAKVATGMTGCAVDRGDQQIEMLFANLPVAPSGVRYPSEPGATYRVGDAVYTPLEGTLALSARVFADSGSETSSSSSSSDSSSSTSSMRSSSFDMSGARQLARAGGHRARHARETRGGAGRGCQRTGERTATPRSARSRST
jgi:hypothetical protein